jgi:aspartokinase
VGEAGVEPIRSEGRCCWLSVIGERMAVRQGHVHWSSRLAEEGVAVRAVEIADRRVTYVLPEDARARAVATVWAMLAPAAR